MDRPAHRRRWASAAIAMGFVLAAAAPAAAAEEHGTERVSLDAGAHEADAPSYTPALSADGRFIAFASDASNLVPGDTNRHRDVFVKDTRTGTTKRVSVGPGGRQASEDSYNPSISADGR
ncbi:MAG: hypothetical protein ACT4QG_18965, partial [Sporichthyaceae bacterium]